MGQFESFCEAISTFVENRIYRWIGISVISPIQAEQLIKHKYILGGWNISPSLIGPLGAIVFGRLFIFYSDRIDDNRRLIRVPTLLSEYYSKYQSRYDSCNDESELEILFTENRTRLI